MTNIELVKKLKDIATNYKTLYVMGCFGAPLNASNKARYCNNHAYNKQPSRVTMINSATDDTFGFDCVCLIKGVLWGWSGDKTKSFGGASYSTNKVPDIDADTMITKCSSISTDFSKIEIGEAVWMKDHIGIYIGEGLAIECSPAWANGVQITACNCSKAGYNRRNWTKHGKLPYIKYETSGYTQTADKEQTTLENSNTPATNSEEVIWNHLMNNLGNAYGVAGLMGNLYAESALKPTNLQQTYETKLGYTDSSYTTAVDNGTYNNFVKDAAGYGLAQWTYWSRKQNLLDYAKFKKKSIGDLSIQLEFLCKELSESYKKVFEDLKTATSILAASNSVLLNFERPADQSTSVQKKRAEYGQKYYDKYVVKEPKPVQPSSPTLKYKVGDIVNFTGKKHYSSANSSKAASTKSSKAKITAISKNNKHPYHCRAIDDSGKFISGVYGWVNESDLSPVKSWIPAIGDVVVYKGRTHYGSANAARGTSCKGGKAIITAIYQLGKSKHPYHLKRISDGGSTVYGWVDAGTFFKE